ncbi:MAG: FAD binding domain-containing protein, partial [candidate division NC10 bacterium]|nr:FAD binding domain-containing protein [candidate division NC10 bacterium]
MRDFEYRAPQTLEEAVGLLAGNGREALPLAGGTDLIPQMDEGRKRPRLLIDLKKIPELTRLTFDERRGLRIGAAVPCSQVSEFPPVRERYPMLASACSLIGSVQIQNRASMGGNLCNAAPSADLAPPLICLRAEAVIVGPNGRRP